MFEDNTAKTLGSPERTRDVRIGTRFNGPPSSGNGGFTTGLLGKHVGVEAEVTLKRPIPLGRAIRIQMRAADAILVDGALEVAAARPATLDLDTPESITLERAAEAEARYRGHEHHPFPSCFVCGTARGEGDGMCLFSGPYRTGMVACTWVPDDTLVDEGGVAQLEVVCAALDCPGAWALIDRYGIEGPFVLGRMAYRIERPVRASDRYEVQGWALGREGRKAFCGTAIYDADGRVCASARATWLELR